MNKLNRKQVFQIALSCSVLMFGLASFSQSQSESQFVIVSNSSIQEGSISKDLLRQLYMGEKSFWIDGQRIRLARHGDSSTIWNQFAAKVLSIQPEQYQSEWRHRLFSGRGVPPKKFESDDEIYNYISKTPGAIAYISSKSYHAVEGIKQLDLTN